MKKPIHTTLKVETVEKIDRLRAVDGVSRGVVIDGLVKKAKEPVTKEQYKRG